MNEQQMRAATAPTPKTLEELSDYITSLLKQPHDYGTCVYAMSLAATAAYNHVASALGVTGFQASCADLDFIRRSRRLEGPFMLLGVENMLYPQYDVPGSAREFLESEDTRQWLADKAREKIAEAQAREGFTPNEAVMAHWETLAAAMPPKPKET